MKNQPTNLSFYIGGFMGESHKVTLEKDSIVYERFEGGSRLTGDGHRIKPTDEQWAIFRKVVDETGVWNWTYEYPNPGVCDGTSWSLLLEYSDKRIEASGDNNFPRKDGKPNGSPSLTPAMKSLCNALGAFFEDVKIR